MSAIPGTTRTDAVTTTDAPHRRDIDADYDRAPRGRRLVTETKAFYKTTEFVAYVALLAGLLIAGAITTAHSTGPIATHHADVLGAHQVWLYATILTIGYMASRGLAKAGSAQPYDEKI